MRLSNRNNNNLLTTHTSQVRLPPLLLILLRRLNRIRGRIDPPPSNNKVRTTPNSRLRRLILLTQLIPLRRKIHTSRENNKVLVLSGSNTTLDLTQRPRRHKAQHKAVVLARIIHRGGGIRASRERALGGHLGEDEEAAVAAVGEVWGLGGLGQGFDDAFAGEDGAVDDVGPFGDAECAIVVLLLNCVADVDEFAVFEDEEVVFGGHGFEARDCFFAEVGEDVDVGFYHGDVGTQTCKGGGC